LQEIHNNYGFHSRRNCLAHYGFAEAGYVENLLIELVPRCSNTSTDLAALLWSEAEQFDGDNTTEQEDIALVRWCSLSRRGGGELQIACPSKLAGFCLSLQCLWPLYMVTPGLPSHPIPRFLAGSFHGAVSEP
jgi:hypothetical protein